MKGIVWCLVALTASMVLGCDEGGTSSGSGASGPQASGTQEHIQWQSSGTFAVPVYGVSCRFTTDTVYSSASNNEIDDSLTLELASDG
ncbi:MAG: hypothetical protein VX938_11765, partial [Myxococcota bacterium]|nr:hypothetical protein [Myxococcota bacterium]